MEWVNPHVWLHIDVKKPDGTVDNWAFEAGTPNVPVQAGLHEGVAAAGRKSSSTAISRRTG
jgi:hypothetical protein